MSNQNHEIEGENMNTIKTRNLEKVKLISADLVFEKPNSDFSEEKFGLRLVYDLFYKNGQIERLTIPHIDMCIPNNRLPEMEYISHNTGFTVCHISSQLSGLRLIQDDSGIIWKTEIVKPADPVEMTVSEIEEALGHPIKIVKDSKDNGDIACEVLFNFHCFDCKHLHCPVNKQPCKKCREIKHTTSGVPTKWQGRNV